MYRAVISAAVCEEKLKYIRNCNVRVNILNLQYFLRQLIQLHAKTRRITANVLSHARLDSSFEKGEQFYGNFRLLDYTCS